MTESTRESQSHIRGQELAEEGKHEKALACIRKQLLDHPDDGQALNDAGAISYALGRYDEAANHLENALSLLGEENATALWNLSEVYFAANKHQANLGLFDRLAEAELLTSDLANRTAKGLLDSGNMDGSAEALIWSLKLCPDQDVLIPMLEVIRSKRPKVAFFCETEDLKFLEDIFGYISARFETEMLRPSTDRQLQEMLQWCDIAWFEWCTNHVLTASWLPKVCRTIVRLHRYEAYRPWPEKVKWENIDTLVTVGNNYVLEQLKSSVPDLEERTRIVPIPNGVDLEKFNFVNRTRGKNIACVAYLNLRKNPMFLLQCFHKLHTIDPEFRLFFAGRHQDPMLKQYLEYMVEQLGLADSVSFVGWQDDVAGWLEDKHYLISGSLGEGHPVNVLEGMARGLKPVLHEFPGSRGFFRPELLFKTVDEFCDRILKDPYESQKYRDVVADNFSLQRQLKSINQIFLGYEQNPWPPEETKTADLKAEAANKRSQEESEYYDELWETRQGKERPLDAVRRKRIVEAIPKQTGQKLRILDLGCGRGILAKHLVDFGDVFGIDLSEEGIEIAKRICEHGTFTVGSFFDVELPRDSFDVVVSQEVIEHLETDDQHRYLGLIFETLRPGGMLLLTTPNQPVMALVNEAFSRESGKPWSDQPIENCLTQQQLQAMVREAGLEVRQMECFIKAMGFEEAHIFLVAEKPQQAAAEESQRFGETRLV